MEFKTGDVVVLKSGQLKMTVKGIIGDPENPLNEKIEGHLYETFFCEKGDLYCQWHTTDGYLEDATFSPRMVKDASDPAFMPYS